MTDWEDRYQAGDIPWEKGQGAPPLTELLDELELEEWGKGPVLVPGCGLGHDVRVLSALGLPVVGVDISPTALELAREFSKTGEETYEQGDFLDPAWREGREFSAVWEHTFFCAIDPADRGRYAEAVAGCLPDDGLLAGVFFLNPFDPGEEASGPPFGVTVDELDAWFHPWFRRVNGWVPHGAFPGREEREWLGLFRKVEQA
ncbi:MAG: methyltransferase domain-containing protein [Verrucomicrobiota bacterium]